MRDSALFHIRRKANIFHLNIAFPSSIDIEKALAQARAFSVHIRAAGTGEIRFACAIACGV